MGSRLSKHIVCAIFSAAASIATAEPAAIPILTEAQSRGKAIYLNGAGADGAEIKAMMGDGGAEVSASLLLCANCHGRDGTGKPEGGIYPSDIRWSELTKPYEVISKSGRKRPAYDEKLLVRAITMGIDSGGRKFDNAMPRYRLTTVQAADLLQYLKIVSTEPERGVTETAIKLGVLLAPTESFPAIHHTAKGILTAFVQRKNQSGGAYGRRIELSFLDLPEDAGNRAVATRDFIDREQPFALIAGFIAGADDEIVSVIESREIPMIGTITLQPSQNATPGRHVFHVYSGIEQQAGALLAYAAGNLALKDPRVVIAIPEGETMRDVADICVREAETLGWKDIQVANLPSSSALSARVPADLVLWLGGSEALTTALSNYSKSGQHPVILALGSHVGKAVLSAPPGFNSKLFLSFPTLPSDQSPSGRNEYRQLLLASGIQEPHLPTGLLALASAKLLEHGLEESGHDLRARKLIEILEELYQFPTGHSPLLTFTRTRRIGAAGAHIVAVDLEKQALSPTGVWATPPSVR